MLPEQVIQLIKKQHCFQILQLHKNTHLDLKHNTVRMYAQIKVKSAKFYKLTGSHLPADPRGAFTDTFTSIACDLGASHPCDKFLRDNLWRCCRATERAWNSHRAVTWSGEVKPGRRGGRTDWWTDDGWMDGWSLKCCRAEAGVQHPTLRLLIGEYWLDWRWCTSMKHPSPHMELSPQRPKEEKRGRNSEPVPLKLMVYLSSNKVRDRSCAIWA